MDKSDTKKLFMKGSDWFRFIDQFLFPRTDKLEVRRGESDGVIFPGVRLFTFRCQGNLLYRSVARAATEA